MGLDNNGTSTIDMCFVNLSSKLSGCQIKEIDLSIVMGSHRHVKVRMRYYAIGLGIQ